MSTQLTIQSAVQRKLADRQAQCLHEWQYTETWHKEEAVGFNFCSRCFLLDDDLIAAELDEEPHFLGADTYKEMI